MLFKFASCSRSFVVLRIVVLRELFAFVRLFDDDHSLDRPTSASSSSQHPARSFELFLVVLRELVVCARSFALIVLLLLREFVIRARSFDRSFDRPSASSSSSRSSFVVRIIN